MAKRIYGDMMSPASHFLDQPHFGLLRCRLPYRLYAESRWRDFVMDNNATLKREIKQMMVENLMLQITASEIGEEQTLFGAGSLGLDSVDALQLVVALDKKYGLKIPDPECAREVLQSVRTMAEAVAKHLASATAERRSSSE